MEADKLKHMKPFEYDGSGTCPCGGTMAMTEIRGVYDGGLFYVCMTDQHHVAHRWPEGDRLRTKAEEVWARRDFIEKQRCHDWTGSEDTSPVAGDDTRSSTVDNDDA